MNEAINKILVEILSGANAYKYLAVLIIGAPVMFAWLLFKAVNRNPDPKTGEVSKFSWRYAIRHNLAIVVYTAIFMNVLALWATSNYPGSKAIVLGMVIGLLSTSLGALAELGQKLLVKKAKALITKILGKDE